MAKSIKLDGIKQAIGIRKSKRAKYLQIKISRLGEVNLVLPNGYSEKDGMKFLAKKSDWVKRKLLAIDFSSNKFRYLGEEIKIKERECIDLQVNTPYLDDEYLIVRNGTNLPKSELYDKWLFNRAEEYIKERTHILARKHGFTFKKVSIKKLKTRWGSCSAAGRLSFNYKLMYFNTKIIDYTIIHELCHLKHMNHGREFWHLVESIIPDYEILKKQLTII